MTEIEGYQDKQVKQRESVWLPTLPQLLSYIGIALLLVLVFHREVLFSWLGGEALEGLGGIGFITEGENYYLDNLFAIPVFGTIAVILFWGAVGCTLYCLVWGLTNTLREAKKYEEASEESVMPSEQNKGKFWASSLANIILMISSVFVFILLLTLAFGYALPLSEQLLTMVLSAPVSTNSFIAITLFLITSIGLGHGLYLSLHTFNYARRIVFF